MCLLINGELGSGTPRMVVFLFLLLSPFCYMGGCEGGYMGVWEALLERS